MVMISMVVMAGYGIVGIAATEAITATVPKLT
jgi:hypothetical protein